MSHQDDPDPVASVKAVLAENEGLRRENSDLRAENARFRTVFAEISQSVVSVLEGSRPPRTSPINLNASLANAIPNLPVRIGWALANSGCETLRHVISRDERQLLNLKNVGHKSVVILKRYLELLGLRLGMTDQELAAIEAEQNPTPPQGG